MATHLLLAVKEVAQAEGSRSHGPAAGAMRAHDAHFQRLPHHQPAEDAALQAQVSLPIWVGVILQANAEWSPSR